MPLTTALIYTRVSSQEQATEGVSLDAQLSECRVYAHRHGYVLGSEHTDVMSGTRDDRPAYQRLLMEARTLHADRTGTVVVVVASLDRLGRRLIERVRARDELKQLGVAVHSVREGGEVSDLVSNILASVAQEESRKLGERVRASREYIRSNGWHLTGRSPWGYRLRDATAEDRADGAPQRVIEPHPDEAPYVRQLFTRLAEGESLRSAGRWVLDLPSVAKGGRRLNFPVVRRIVRNPIYVAVAPARWEPLISEALFAQVQGAIDSHAHTPHQASGSHLLTGFLRCQICGARAHGKRGGQPARWAKGYYTCDQPQENRPSYHWSISQRGANQAVLTEVLRVLGTMESPSVQAKWHKAIKGRRQPREDERVRQTQLGRLRRELERERDHLTAATRKYIDNGLDRESFELARDTARQEIVRLEGEIARLEVPTMRTTIPSLDSVGNRLPGWIEGLGSAAIMEQRSILRVLVKQVTVEHRGKSRHHPYQAVITWTALGEVLADFVASLTDDGTLPD